MWFVIRQCWLNPLICGERGACRASQRCVNWNLDTTSETRWGPLSLLVFTRLASALSHRLSHSFFSNQVRFYQGPSVSNRYRLWNFRRQSVWEPQYQLCSSHPAPLQTRGRFLKRREKLHKEHIGGRFNTNRQWKYFHTLLNLSSLFPPFSALVFFVYHLSQTVPAHCKIDLQHLEITFEERPPFTWI